MVGLRALFLAVLILAGGPAVADAQAAEGPRGPLMIAGGEFSFGNEGWRRFVDVAGGKDARVLVIPTASGDAQGNGDRAVRHFESLGATATLVPLFEGQHGPARDPQWVAAAEKATGIWFIGGDQGRITGALLEEGGADTPLLAAIRRANAKGAIIGGTSAGAAIMSARMFKEGPEPLDALVQPMEPGRHTDTGLGFIGSGWFVDQHFLARGRIGRIIPAMRDLGYRLGVGVEEDTAILVRDGVAEVVGARGVVLVDLKDARLSKGAPLTAEGVGIGFAGVGDRFDLATGTITPSAAKAGGTRVEPAKDGFKPYYGEAAWYADMLGPGILYEAMIRALDGKAGSVGGLAFRPDQEVGVEFTLSRTPSSHGWFASGQGYTVAGLRLDLRPVRMARPLYTPVAGG